MLGLAMEPPLLDVQRLHWTEQVLLERCVAIIINLRIMDDVKLSGEESGQFVTSTKYVKILQEEFHFQNHHHNDRHLNNDPDDQICNERRAWRRGMC